MDKNLTFWTDEQLHFSCPGGCGGLQPDPDVAGIGVRQSIHLGHVSGAHQQ